MMKKFANVVFAYSPKNDDELKLQVGDRIELIGPEEEGWWKGNLNGRIGLFPSNFVEVIEIDQRPILSSASSATTILPPVPNKLSLFGSAPSKSSLAAISLSSNNSMSTNNNNLTMNNTRPQDDSGSAFSDGSQSMTSIEKRPRPIRGPGYGDIFASGTKQARQPLADTSTNSLPSERLNTSLTDTLQKQIPKKPPPPAPIAHNDGNSLADQAPALPPKPSNHFSPLGLQHTKPFQHILKQNQPRQPLVREKARVIYSYEPTNDDELTIKVGDIIDIIEKDIEDAGWWKGELRGKIGVFPDNFVEVIEAPPIEALPTNHTSSINSTSPNSVDTKKIKSVFAATPKGFSKELENNLEKHNNSQASFLSLKRNKLQQQQMVPFVPSGSAESASVNGNGVQDEEDLTPSGQTNTIKLNHITAQRAKGPTRKPPSNILNKRNQLMDQVKRETNGKDEPVSLPDPMLPAPVANADLPLLPPSQHVTPHSIVPLPIKPSLSLENVIESQKSTPETSQRMNRAIVLDRSKETPTTNATTPHWMVELKKAHAEKKRETPSSLVPHADELNATGKANDVPTSTNDASPLVLGTSSSVDKKPTVVPQLKGTQNLTPMSAPHDCLGDQIKNDINDELTELRQRVSRLEKDSQEINELKSMLDVMRIELKTCQSAIDNQRKYIKDLVNNLADERKKIAAMQVEIDRNLK